MSAKLKGSSVFFAVLRILSRPPLWKAAVSCTASIIRNFFILQYRGALFRKIPVSRVDDPLDAKIPFRPEEVGIYLDFTAFWIRALAFILGAFGDRAAGTEKGREYLLAIGRLYAFAAQVYAKNLSTTERPRYLGRPGFLLIHAFDPHLMCVPSLHVMLAIFTYTSFRSILEKKGKEGEEEKNRFALPIGERRRRALAITAAVLYVKQHSFNCVAAAMYAMTRFDRALFPPSEAEAFASALFPPEAPLAEADRERIRGRIISLYRRFLAEGEKAPVWEAPLLEFLREKREDS